MNHQPLTQAYGPVVSRLADVMAHSNRYSGNGVTTLAADAGVSPASISRVMRGLQNPSALLVGRIISALELELGLRIDPRDVFSESGRFLTKFVCDVAGCRGCLPENALDEFGVRKSAFVGVKPGHWVGSRFPRGYSVAEGAHE